MSLSEYLKNHNTHSWLPFTQMKLADPPIVIERGKGECLYTEDGREIIDGIGSWWVSIHGHNHPHLIEAAKNQLSRLDHVIYNSFVHKPALDLSVRLSEKTNHNLPRVFFSDNGSTAVEVGIKMAFQFFQNRGQRHRTKLIALDAGYHGDTIGAMSAGARSVFHGMYEPLLYPVHHVPEPRVPFRIQGNEEEEMRAMSDVLEALENTFARIGEESFGFILEPLLQGASGGMNVYPASYLKRVRELCNRYGVFLIADEVFTGFGRTGKFFAFEHAGIWPDVLALSKGLTSGVVPFAVTLAREEIYQAYYSEDRSKTFFHGHSMTANPVGAAVAGASLDLMEREQTTDQLNRLWTRHAAHLHGILHGPLKEKGIIQEARFLGSVSVIELKDEATGQGYTGNFGWNFLRKSLEKGVLLRPLGNVIYLAPPYSIGEKNLERLYSVIEENLMELF